MRKDMVIPLSEPIKTTTGGDITSIPVERGQQVYLAFLTYNRFVDLTLSLFLFLEFCSEE